MVIAIAGDDSAPPGPTRWELLARGLQLAATWAVGVLAFWGAMVLVLWAWLDANPFGALEVHFSARWEPPASLSRAGPERLGTAEARGDGGQGKPLPRRDRPVDRRPVPARRAGQVGDPGP